MNDIETLLKTTIQIKVVEAFNSAPQMVEKLVEAALSQEVNHHGGKPNGYGEKGMPFMDFLVGNEIRNAMKACVSEYVETHKEEIRARVAQAIESSDFAQPLANSITEILSQRYNW